MQNKKLTMKHIPLLLIISFTFFSCKKEEAPPLLRIPVTNLRFPVNATLQPPDTYYIPINQVKMNALAFIQAKGLDTAQIKSIRPGRATLSVVFGEAKLDFLDAVSIRLCPLGQNEPNCGREAFYRDPVPFNTGYDLDLVPSDVKDLRGMVLMENINIQVKLERLRGFPNGSFDVNLDMDFDVR